VNPLVLGSSPSGPTNSRSSVTIGDDRRGTVSGSKHWKNRCIGLELAYKRWSPTIAEGRGRPDISGVAGCKADPKELGIAMYLQNFHGCFISRKFAERLARLYVEEKYDSSLFVAGNGNVVDGDEVWWVTFDNNLPNLEDSIRPKGITVEIRKTNGQIIALPAELPKEIGSTLPARPSSTDQPYVPPPPFIEPGDEIREFLQGTWRVTAAASPIHFGFEIKTEGEKWFLRITTHSYCKWRQWQLFESVGAGATPAEVKANPLGPNLKSSKITIDGKRSGSSCLGLPAEIFFEFLSNEMVRVSVTQYLEMASRIKWDT
jgi:hypothetical protein